MHVVRREGLRRFVWLASWPKSGNTWVRFLLAHFLRESRDPLPLSEVASLPSLGAFDRGMFDTCAGVLSGQCTDDEAESMRPAVYRCYAEANVDEAASDGSFLFSKTHDACCETSSGEPLFPEAVTAGAIYVIRNPLDVATSFAFHNGDEDMSKAIARLNDSDFVLAGLGTDQLRSRVGDWSSHVESWTRAPFPVHVVRYEDLLADPRHRFAEIVRFLDLDDGDESRLCRAVEHSSFSRLQESEDREGFRERARFARRFFRTGRAGDWRNHLSAQQARAVVDAHEAVMSAWGYDGRALLDESCARDEANRSTS